MKSPQPYDAAASVALLDFNEEAVPYCQGIAETDAHEYAMDYARMLRSRAKGAEFKRTNVLTHLFEPNQKLISATLDRMYRKHFAA